MSIFVPLYRESMDYEGYDDPLKKKSNLRRKSDMNHLKNKKSNEMRRKSDMRGVRRTSGMRRFSLKKNTNPEDDSYRQNDIFDPCYDDYDSEIVEPPKQRSDHIMYNSKPLYETDDATDVFDPAYEEYERDMVRNRRGAKQNSESSLMLYDKRNGIDKNARQRQYQKSTRGRHTIDASVSVAPSVKSVRRTSKTNKRPSLFRRKNKDKDGSKEELKSSHALLKQVMKDPSKLVPGAYSPFVEATIVREMKEIASSETKKGQPREAYKILKQVIRCERATLGRDNPQVANTLYHIGVALNFMGDSKGALLALQDGIRILFPQRFKIENMDLAALFYQYAVIEGNRGDYHSALYHLDLAGQVESHLLGHCSEKIAKKVADYKYAQKSSQKLKENRSRAA